MKHKFFYAKYSLFYSGGFLVRKLSADYSEEWGICFTAKKKLWHFISKPELDPSQPEMKKD